MVLTTAEEKLWSIGMPRLIFGYPLDKAALFLV
jgi:hypothetical protein